MGDRSVEAMQDAELVKAFIGGSVSVFDQLVIRHKDRVFSVCYLFLGDHSEAGDCAQETFIKVFRSLKKFRFESAFSTWIYRIAVNTCKNRLKSSEYRKKKKTLSLTSPEGKSENPVAGGLADQRLSPAEELENRQRHKRILEAIDSLSHDHKSVVILRDMEGLSYEEITRITGFGMGTVKSRLARARTALRDLLRSER